MIIFAGHQSTNQGARNAYTTEFVECSLICQQLTNYIDIQFIASDTVENKVKLIETICDSVNIDIHFSTSSKSFFGAEVLYQKNNSKSRQYADILQRHFNNFTNYSNSTNVGYYHNNKNFGIDYFLRNSQPSIIVNVAHWEHCDKVNSLRNEYAECLANGLFEIMELSKNVGKIERIGRSCQ